MLGLRQEKSVLLLHTAAVTIINEVLLKPKWFLNVNVRAAPHHET